jgi:hypothetical protein
LRSPSRKSKIALAVCLDRLIAPHAMQGRMPIGGRAMVGWLPQSGREHARSYKRF